MSRLPTLIFAVTLATATLAAATAAQAAGAAYGPELQGFRYPYPLQHFRFNSQGQTMQMAYMDVAPVAKPNGRTAVLMHGKNFCGATWETTITALARAGYRVIAPDQVGFCASTKPPQYQYSFHQLAANTMELLKKVGVGKAVLVGHSTGGMLATRFALMYPQAVTHLVMVNPIGLEDWKQLGVPYRTVDQWFERELKLTADSVRSYEKKHLLHGPLEARIRQMGRHAGGPERRPGPAARRLELGADLRHDLHPARRA